MPERWVDDVLGAGERMPTRTDERLRDELSAMWGGADAATFAMEPIERSPRAPRPWRGLGLVVAAAAALAITVVVVVAASDDPTVTDDPVPAPSTQPSTTLDSFPGPVEPITPEAIVDVTWAVGEVDRQPPISQTPWFRLEPDGMVQGFDGCNTYGGSYEINGDALRVRRLVEMSIDGCALTDWHSTRVAAGELTLAGNTLISRGTNATRESGRVRDVELRATGVETLAADAAAVPGRYVDETVEHEIIFEADGEIVEPGGCGDIGRWRIDDGLVIESDVADDDPCWSIAVEGRGGISPGGSIVVFDEVHEGLPQIVSFRPYDLVDATFDYALDVEVPADGGEPLRPQVFATVASDAGESGPPLIAVSPDSIVTVRDAGGLLVQRYGRASGELVPERLGLDGIVRRPVRILGSETGVLYAQLDECTFAAFVEDPAIDTFELVERVEYGCDTSLLKALIRVVPEGLAVGDEIVIVSPVDSPAPGPIVELGRPPVVIEDDNPDVAVLSVDRRDGLRGERSWLGWVERAPDQSPGFTLTHLAPFGRGVAVGLSNGDGTPILVTLGPDGGSRSYALGDWSIAGIDERGAVFWRQTPDDRGIELGRLAP